MPAQISMPQQSDTMTEGTVVKWLAKEGDRVKAGQIIAEIETDKATMEMESFDSGTVAALLVKEGEKVPVGTLIAVLAAGNENPADIKQKYASGAAAAPAPFAAPMQWCARQDESRRTRLAPPVPARRAPPSHDLAPADPSARGRARVVSR